MDTVLLFLLPGGIRPVAPVPAQQVLAHARYVTCHPLKSPINGHARRTKSSVSIKTSITIA